MRNRDDCAQVDFNNCNSRREVFNNHNNNFEADYPDQDADYNKNIRSLHAKFEHNYEQHKEPTTMFFKNSTQEVQKLIDMCGSLFFEQNEVTTSEQSSYNIR